MRMVYCTFSVIGFHLFEDAPEEVTYLSRSHRHKFEFKVTIEVAHDNREIEFHTLKRDCLSIVSNINPGSRHCDLAEGEINFNRRSCEMIADELIAQLIQIKKYGNFLGAKGLDIYDGLRRQIVVEVSEDGENGGIVSRL